MARSKQYVSFKLPFIKKVKINKGIVMTIIGLAIALSGLIGVVSFIQTGSVLILIHNHLKLQFGFFSILFPILLLSLSTHFFNSKKLKIVKPHVTVGMGLIFISLMGFFGTGRLGGLIRENLTLDFSPLGAFIILFVTFMVGLVLFFNTSLDVFLLMAWEWIKKALEFVQSAKPAGVGFGQPEEKKAKKSDEFITNNQQQIQAPIITSPAKLPPVTGSKITIRPMSGEEAKNWHYPELSLMADIKEGEADAGDVALNSNTIEKTLDSFGIRARVAEINKGPTVTQYAIEIVMGTKLSKVTALTNDLALALAAPTGQVRIEAPIPGKSLVGIEIPNRRSETVALKRMLTSEELIKDTHPLAVPLGLDVAGRISVTNIAKMPHLLIAGTTGSGKSVMLNAIICSLLYRTTPKDLRFILVDPKRVELAQYNGVPHLLTEVIVEADKILSALKWTVSEMENRYKTFAKVGARNIESYNANPEVESVPYIIFVIDELADLMIYAPAEAEESITRIAQMARATGIHLILATQRPSVDVITGLMKANIPSRMAFNVPSLIDSRVVLDQPGAEKLVGRGDMLFLPPDQAKPRRIQGPYLSDSDIKNIVDFLKKSNPAVHYTEEITEQDLNIVTTGPGRMGGSGGNSGDKQDQFFNQAAELAYQYGKASASLFQRRLKVGYSRAARILDELEAAGIVSPGQGSKPRDVIARGQATQAQESTDAELPPELEG